MATIQQIEDLLPQTQCGECGYAGCLPYAQAIIKNEVAINKCPPGGVALVEQLASVLNLDPAPYLKFAAENMRTPAVAVIKEQECIGCTICIKACPVDAIIGSGKLLHTIISSECTGCGLCLEPCPVDCIDLLPVPVATYDKQLAQQRFNAKIARKKQLPIVSKEDVIKTNNDKTQKYIFAALERVQQKKNKL